MHPGRSSFRSFWKRVSASSPMTAEDSANRASQQPDTITTPSRRTSTSSLHTSSCAISRWSAFRWVAAKWRVILASTEQRGVTKAVIIGGIPPYLLKTSDNPDGIDGSVFEGIQKAVAADRYAFFTEFFKNFFNTDVFLGKRISEQAVQASWNVAASASATASLACVPTWHEDFRNDLTRIDVPTLVIHGDADRIVPIKASGEKTAKLVKGARLVAIKDGPHAVSWTHADEVNVELVNFLGKGAAKRAASTS